MPVYNSEKFIDRSLQSCIAQDYKGPIEIIMVNDGSKDGSVERIKNVMHSNSNNNRKFKLFTQENQGASAARNYGVHLSNSENIMFLDSDDYLENGAISAALESLNSSGNVGLVYSDHRKVTDSGQPIMDRVKGPFALDKLLTGMYIGHFRALPRKVFDKVGGFDPSLTHSEDYDFVLKIATEGFDVKYINEILYNYVTNQDSLSQGTNGLEKIIRGGQESILRALRRLGFEGEIDFDVPHKTADTVTRYLNPEKVNEYLEKSRLGNKK